MNESLHNQKHAVITGGVQGLGYGAAKSLLADGYVVSVVDLLSVEEANEKLATLGSEFIDQVHYFQQDLRETASIAETVQAIWSEVGPIHVLVLSAGIATRPVTPLLDITSEQYDVAMDINVKGSFFFAQAVAAEMTKDSTEHNRAIIFVSSIAGRRVSTVKAPYTISKAAVGTMTKLFAMDLAPYGVSVFEIQPGIMKTDMVEAELEVYEKMLEDGSVPLKRWGTPEDFGVVVSSLADQALPYVTGQAIALSGGLQIQSSAVRR